MWHEREEENQHRKLHLARTHYHHNPCCYLPRIRQHIHTGRQLQREHNRRHYYYCDDGRRVWKRSQERVDSFLLLVSTWTWWRRRKPEPVRAFAHALTMTRPSPRAVVSMSSERRDCQRPSCWASATRTESRGREQTDVAAGPGRGRTGAWRTLQRRTFCQMTLMTTSTRTKAWLLSLCLIVSRPWVRASRASREPPPPPRASR